MDIETCQRIIEAVEMHAGAGLTDLAITVGISALLIFNTWITKRLKDRADNGVQ